MKPVDQEFTHQPEIGQPVALPAGMPEPDAYMFQHEETGLVQFVDAQQVEWGFEENNPRLKRIDAAYTAAQVQAMLAQGLAPGWKAVPVKPTDAMVSAMLDWGTKQSEWAAILAAAPQPPVAQPSSAAVERKPLTKAHVCRNIGFSPTK